jgi:dolichol-phosphate mannosyltransferase
MDNTQLETVELSVVAPVFNEQEGIQKFALTLRDVLEDMKTPYEVIFVDDGSTDASFLKLSEIDWPKMRVLRFLRNSGHQSALDAGYRASLGNHVVTLDSDMQHPPEVIPELYKVAKSRGVDVVYAIRPKREGDGLFKKLTARIYYWLMAKLTDVQIEPNAADFRLVSRRVVTTLNLLPPGGQVFRLLIPSLGFSSEAITYRSSERFAGASKYKITKMASLGIDSVIQSSVKPLKIAIQFGIGVSVLSGIGFGYVLVVFALQGTVQGWSSVISAVLLLFGALFVFLGIIGSYLSILVKRAQAMPPYLLWEENRK